MKSKKEIIDAAIDAYQGLKFEQELTRDSPLLPVVLAELELLADIRDLLAQRPEVEPASGQVEIKEGKISVQFGVAR